MNDKQVIEWLQGQLAKFEQSLAARVSMSESWAGGTTESWRQAGCRLNKKQRLAHAETHRRIAAKCRHDVEMCKAALVKLTTHPAMNPFYIHLILAHVCLISTGAFPRHGCRFGILLVLTFVHFVLAGYYA